MLKRTALVLAILGASISPSLAWSEVDQIDAWGAQADTAYAPFFTPDPWTGPKSNHPFVGTQPKEGPYQAAAIRLNNNATNGKCVFVTKVVAYVGQAWRIPNINGPISLCPNDPSLIVTQTQIYGARNTNDFALCGLPKPHSSPSSLIPAAFVTFMSADGTEFKTVRYNDPAQVLNCGGVDMATVHPGVNKGHDWVPLVRQP